MPIKQVLVFFIVLSWLQALNSNKNICYYHGFFKHHAEIYVIFFSKESRVKGEVDAAVGNFLNS